MTQGQYHQQTLNLTQKPSHDRLYRHERLLKNIALYLGLLSAITIVFDLYPYTMFLSFPFCLIWAYCGWLRTEPQLKWINLVFLIIYGYGIIRYMIG